MKGLIGSPKISGMKENVVITSVRITLDSEDIKQAKEDMKMLSQVRLL